MRNSRYLVNGEQKKLAILLPLALAGGCTNSPLQPTISDRSLPPTVASVVASGAGGAPAPADAVTCTRSKGHNVYYAGSTVTLSYSCTAAVTGLELAGAPAFLKGTASGTTVQITGTAPSKDSSTSWSFIVNGLLTQGDAAAVKTAVITSQPTVSLATPSPSLTYNTVTNLKFSTVNLDPAWDGATDDVTLSLLPGTAQGSDLPTTFNEQAIAATDTDALGLTYFESCSAPTGSYLCPQPTTASGSKSVAGGGELLWNWSPFDQGQYKLSVRPLLTVEGAEMRLPAVSAAYTIPEQTFGNVPLTVSNHPDAGGDMDGQIYSYGFAVNSQLSTPSAPVLGLTYQSETAHGAAFATSYFTRYALDRTVSPLTATPAGVTQSSSLKLTGTDNSTLSKVVALGDGSWAEVTNDLTGPNLDYNHLSDSAASPAVKNSIAIVSPVQLIGLDVSEPFVDQDGTTRLGVAYVDYNGGAPFFGVGKLNPAGTTTAAINDSPGFETDNTDFELPGTHPARIAIAAGTLNGAPAFYLAYQDTTSLEVGWVNANADTSSGFTTLASVFSDEVGYPAITNGQSLSLAVGTSGGEQIIASAYRESDANPTQSCYFRRVGVKDDGTFTSASTAITLSSGTDKCLEPSISYNAASGRFVVTYAEQVSGTWQIMSREITLGGTDTASTSVAVAQLGATEPIKLQTAFYPAGNWMGVLYRIQGSDAIKVHGYHVSPF